MKFSQHTRLKHIWIYASIYSCLLLFLTSCTNGGSPQSSIDPNITITAPATQQSAAWATALPIPVDPEQFNLAHPKLLIQGNVSNLTIQGGDKMLILIDGEEFQPDEQENQLYVVDLSQEISDETKENKVEVTVPYITDLDINITKSDIKVERVYGQFNITTWEGNITITDVIIGNNSSFNIRTGTIHFSGLLDPKSKTSFQTGEGNINVNLPARSTFRADAMTTNGKIVTEFPLQIDSLNGGSRLYGVIGNNPLPLINISISSGDINITGQ